MEKNSPQISVLLSVFNTPEIFLRKSIESIFEVGDIMGRRSLEEIFK